MQAGIIVDHLAGAIIIPDSLPIDHRADAEFVAALQSGSEDAFTRLIELYHQPVYSLVFRSLRDPADAADITQEIFLKVYRGIRNFHGESSLRTWIYRIAIHEASNQRRWWIRHKRREIAIEADASGRDPSQYDSAPISDSIADLRPSPYDIAAQKELNATISFALSRVPEVFRDVLILREIEGFAYDEIAAVLNIQPGTVKSRLMRGRASLRAALAELNSPHLPQLQQTKPARKSNHITALVSPIISHVENAFRLDHPISDALSSSHTEEAAL
jgi:RNA polymerase sigma-70 factor (ECF subfamily)